MGLVVLVLLPVVEGDIMTFWDYLAGVTFFVFFLLPFVVLVFGRY